MSIAVTVAGVFVSRADLDERCWRWQASPALPRLLLISEKKETSLLYKKLSLELHRSAVVGEAPSSDAKIIAAFGADKFPAIFVSGPGPHEPDQETYAWTRYEGKRRRLAVGFVWRLACDVSRFGARRGVSAPFQLVTPAFYVWCVLWGVMCGVQAPSGTPG